jgi:hypothetical protein
VHAVLAPHAARTLSVAQWATHRKEIDAPRGRGEAKG